MGLGGPGDTPPHPKHATSIMTQALPLPPLEVLQNKFDYNPETGILTYRDTQRPAGYTNGRGWLRVKIAGKHYKVHRIAWKMHYGEDPANGLQMDHINRQRSDNRICNLRVVTAKENVSNSDKAPLAAWRQKRKCKSLKKFLRKIEKECFSKPLD